MSTPPASGSVTPAANRGRGTRSEIFAWAMYDWANSAWSTLSITIVVVYLTTVVLPNRAGPLAYAYCIGISMFVAAVLGPIIGAVADHRANKRTWLAITALGGALAAVAIGILPEHATVAVVAAFFIASLGAELSFGIYNGFLPELADDESMNRVSAYGFALGYIGGGLALVAAMVIMILGGKLGLPDASPLNRDYQSTTDGQFTVDVPYGHYHLKVLLGDPVAAHDNMQLRWPDGQTTTAKTKRGEIARLEHEADAVDGKLTLHVGAPDAPAVPIIGMTIVGENPPFEAQFDFGTAHSSVEPGYLFVMPGDEYAVHDLAAEKRLSDDFLHATAKSDDSLSAAAKALREHLRIDALRDRYPADGSQDAAGPLTKLGFGWQAGDISARDPIMSTRYRVCMLILGAWWGLFTLPALFLLHDRGKPSAVRRSLFQEATGAMREVGRTLTNVKQYKMLVLFLIGFLFYNDGMQTVISQASIFAQTELKMTGTDLGMLVLMIQFVSLPGALLMAGLSDKIGSKTTLLICLAIWIGLVTSAYFVTTKGQFWVMGVVLALVMGGAQSVSRAIMGIMTPPSRSGEFMGFFNLSGRAASMAGPLMFSTILTATGSAHWAILSLLSFFIVGTLFVLPVDVAQGKHDAFEAEAPTTA